MNGGLAKWNSRTLLFALVVVGIAAGLRVGGYLDGAQVANIITVVSGGYFATNGVKGAAHAFRRNGNGD